MNNMRSSRIAEELKKEISDIIMHKIKDPRIEFVTVTDVELTNDLQQAKVFISVLNDKNKDDTLDGLEKANGFIRSEIGKRIRLRKVPEILFKYDESLAYGNKIDSIIRDLKKDE